jgi:hypothetical protein
MIVNSANVTDPVTGESAINPPIEAVQPVEVLTNLYCRAGQLHPLELLQQFKQDQAQISSSQT